MEFIIMFALVCIMIYGYAANIFKLVTVQEDGFLKLLRVFGIFVPLVGIIAGFIN